LRRKQENRELDKDEFSKQVQRFKNHFLALINCVQFNESILDVLETKIPQYSMRALDAIHLASACGLERILTRTANLYAVMRVF